MTVYLSILWITMLSGPIEGASYGIPYISEEACKAAIAPVSNTLDYDHNLECESLPVEQEMLP